VVAPIWTPINISLKAKLAEDVTQGEAKAAIVEALQSLFKSLIDSNHVYGTLKYVAVSAAINSVEKVLDFKRLRLNGTLENVEFGEDHMPQITANRIELNDYD
ncbi:MAG: hypothetical protein IJP42_10520, partial [Selenomonadaceae bacterium]|nr:hypothetical protein [Selenomonadaceae bacterium]